MHAYNVMLQKYFYRKSYLSDLKVINSYCLQDLMTLIHMTFVKYLF